MNATYKNLGVPVPEDPMDSAGIEAAEVAIAELNPHGLWTNQYIRFTKDVRIKLDAYKAGDRTMFGWGSNSILAFLTDVAPISTSL